MSGYSEVRELDRRRRLDHQTEGLPMFEVTGEHSRDESYIRSRATIAKQARSVLACLAAASEPLCYHQVAERLRIPATSAERALNGLKEGDEPLVKSVGVRYWPATGRNIHHYVITEAGRRRVGNG